MGMDWRGHQPGDLHTFGNLTVKVLLIAVRLPHRQPTLFRYFIDCFNLYWYPEW